ncbi:hypothetical protein [Escherichia coli]|uniref:hypothetical protein n=1 Tax=Escherichia coli TaxID=562 RepID=UPI0030D5E4F3
MGDKKSGYTNSLSGTLSAITDPDKFYSIDITAYNTLNKINSQSISKKKRFLGLICKDNSENYNEKYIRRPFKPLPMSMAQKLPVTMGSKYSYDTMVQKVIENMVKGTKYFKEKYTVSQYK